MGASVLNRVVDIVSVLSLLSVRLLLVFTGAFALAACSSNAIRIRYDSEPQGAMITAVDSIAALGRAPVVKAYNLDVDLEIAIERGRKLSIERDRRVYGGVQPPRSNPTGIE